MGLYLTYYTNDYINLRERNEGCLVPVGWQFIYTSISQTQSLMLNQTNSLWLSFQSLEQKKQYFFTSQMDLQRGSP